MSEFHLAAKQLVGLHGLSCQLVSVGSPTYNISTGTASSVETTANIIAYKKHIVATPYRLPNLVGKDVAEFYIPADGLTTAPKPKDKIIFSGSTYDIDSVKEHAARGSVALYVVVGVRS